MTKLTINPRLILSLCAVILAGVLLSAGLVSGAPTMQFDPVPTLVPPTLVPFTDAGTTDALPTESGVARILRDGNVRIGILFNEPNFGELGVRCCDVIGFDADLARAIAETWGVQLEGKQVTRQTGIDMLVNGDIDLLIAAQPHDRALDSRVEFSQSYYPGAQSIMVRDGDGATVLDHFADRVVGVVVGTRAEAAVAAWQARAGYTINVRQFYTLDQAIAALYESQIDGVVASRHRLALRIRQPADGRIVEEPVQSEPYAIAVRRQDVNLRNAVNRTLQYFAESGRLNEIHRTNFSDANYPDGFFVSWANVGSDAPRLDQFGGDVPLPSTYVVPRLQSERQIRVAGLTQLPADAPESARRLDQLNRLLVNALASRWQVTVVDLDDNGQNPLELVASGQADLAVGVEPNWDAAGQVDFTGYYLLHGLRLMVETNSGIAGIADLRGKWVGVFSGDEFARAVVTQRAEAERAIIDDFFSILREQDAAFGMLVENNYDAVMGDSLRLIAHVQANPDALQLTTNADGDPVWFSRSYIAMAVPRNDIDFRLLVEYTLQELVRDGTLTGFLNPVLMPSDVPHFEIWPGSSMYLGYDLDGVGG